MYDEPSSDNQPSKTSKTAAAKAKPNRLNPKLVKDAVQREKDRNLKKALEERAEVYEEPTAKPTAKAKAGPSNMRQYRNTRKVAEDPYEADAETSRSRSRARSESVKPQAA